VKSHILRHDTQKDFKSNIAIQTMNATEHYACDIVDNNHYGATLVQQIVPVMSYHDQEDGRSKQDPYFELIKIDICEGCYKTMITDRILLYAYKVAMGYNKYYLNKQP